MQFDLKRRERNWDQFKSEIFFTSSRAKSGRNLGGDLSQIRIKLDFGKMSQWKLQYTRLYFLQK